MRVYYNSDGTVTSIHRGPPEWAPQPDHLAIDLPDQNFDELGGLRIVNGALVRTGLDIVKANAVTRINDRIGRIRATFVTDIVAQPLVYAAKEDEARTYVADPAPDLADYPLLSAETGPGLTAPDAWSLAQIWLNMASQWRQTAAGLEQARLGSIYSVQTATTESEIDAALAAFEGSLP